MPVLRVKSFDEIPDQDARFWSVEEHLCEECGRPMQMLVDRLSPVRSPFIVLPVCNHVASQKILGIAKSKGGRND